PVAVFHHVRSDVLEGLSRAAAQRTRSSCTRDSKARSIAQLHGDLAMKHDKTTHWTGLKLSETLMMDALLKHLLGLMPYGMTDLGEVMEVVGQLKPDDEDQWIASWSELAQRIHSR